MKNTNTNNKQVAKITHIHKTPTQHVDLWFVDVEYMDGTTGKKKPLNNSTFMGLVLRLRLTSPDLVCKLPEIERGEINFGL